MASDMLTKRFVTLSPEETRKVAADLARNLRPGAVIALHGELGAGKTCFVQGLAEALGVTRTVNSPTYTLISEHHGRLQLNHIDFYRIHNANEALDVGLDEYLDGEGVTAIEWADRVDGLLPARTIHVHMQPGSTPDERVITIRTFTSD
ncbi:MAG: tRNA (adenosine(37)-N6)-threonylcarbamoyltransferase complex ATPase subunit type 1 TsaE [bacterium]